MTTTPIINNLISLIFCSHFQANLIYPCHISTTVMAYIKHPINQAEHSVELSSPAPNIKPNIPVINTYPNAAIKNIKLLN